MPPEATSRQAGSDRPTRLFMKQVGMRRMMYALIPVMLTAVYFFGWRAMAVVAACTAGGLATEWITSRRRGAPISMACFVTCWLYALSLPITVGWGVALVGVVVAVLFGKEVFGGFGRNFANPAIVGRAFVYICFPTALTASFVPAFKGFPAGLTRWSLASSNELPAYLAGPGRDVADAVTQASPMWVAKQLGPETARRAAGIPDMATGSIGGTYRAPGGERLLAAGSMGEGCAIVIVLAAAYLLVTKTANWRLMAGAAAGLAAATGLLRHLLGFDTWTPGQLDVPPLHFTLLAGTTLYATVFMITEPVSAPKQRPAMLAYGFLIGFLIVLLRWRGIFVAAASFSILLGNMAAPLLDMAAKAWRRRAERSERGEVAA